MSAYLTLGVGVGDMYSLYVGGVDGSWVRTAWRFAAMRRNALCALLLSVAPSHHEPVSARNVIRAQTLTTNASIGVPCGGGAVPSAGVVGRCLEDR